MTKIAIASCRKIRGQKSQKNQPVWAEIEAERPDLLLLLGDNVYMRQRSRPRWDLEHLNYVYKLQFEEEHFASVTNNVPFMAIWDDHDFGPNDSRGDSKRDKPYRAKSRRLFHKYMAKGNNNNRPEVYCTQVADDIKIIMLDVRYYRTGLRQRDPTILGAKQEKWLWQELNHDHKFTIVGSGTCLESGGPYDKWSAYRDAYRRLRERLDQVPRLLFVAGDLHVNKFNRHNGFYEIISSGIGRTSGGRSINNYGIIDFGKTRVKVSLRGRDRREKRIRTSNWKAD